MIKNIYKKAITLTLMTATIFGVAIHSGLNKKDAIGTSALELNKYAVVNPEEYYAEISTSATGDILRKQIYDLMISTHRTYTSYSDLAEAFLATDVNPNNPGQVELFYTGEYRNFNGINFTGSINREHVWPDSRGVGKEGPGSDAHHLRPCDVTVNGNRGNLGYSEPGDGGYTPTDSYKGVAARLIFYVGAHYGPDHPSYGLTMNEVINTSGSGVKTFGSLKTLLKWNLQFPVNTSEIRRNVAAQKIQGNRNPFIDEPNYACRIWGDTNAETKSICEGTTPVESDPDVNNVINLIESIGTVNSNSESKIIAAENAYSALSTEQKAKVSNYQTLVNARNKFDNLGGGGPISSSEVFFDFYYGTHTTSGTEVTATYLNGAIKTEGIDDIVSSVSISGTVEFNKNNGLTLGSSNNSASLTINFANALNINSIKVNALRYAADTTTTLDITDEYLSVSGIVSSVESEIIWTFDETSKSSITFISSPKRSTIFKMTIILKEEPQVNPIIQELIDLIDTLDLDNITLADEEIIDYAFYLYENELSEDEKALITNYDSLLQANSILNTLLIDIETANEVVNLIAPLVNVTISSGTTISQAENAYNNLTTAQKGHVFNYSTLLQARATYDDFKAQEVINLINGIGEVTLSSNIKINQARDAYNNLENPNQISLVTNFSVLQQKEVIYNDLLNADDLIPNLDNATWSNTTVQSSPHVISEENRNYDLSSGKLENGQTYLGADASNADKLVFNQNNGFNNLESLLNGNYNYYVGFMMSDFALSKPTSIVFSWSDVTTIFEVSLLISIDGGNTWEALANLNSVAQGGSISWSKSMSPSMRKLANPNSSYFAQYAIILGTNTPGYMENLTMSSSFDGRQVDINSDLDILKAHIENAETCVDYINAPQYGLLYEQLEALDKSSFDNYIGLDGVNVKKKLDYMINLHEFSKASEAKSPSVLEKIIEKENIILVSLLTICIALLTISYINKRKTAITDC